MSSAGTPQGEEQTPGGGNRWPRVGGLTAGQWAAVAPILRDYGPLLVLLWLVVIQMPKIQQDYHDELTEDRRAHAIELQTLSDRTDVRVEKLFMEIRQDKLKLLDDIRALTEEVKKLRARAGKEGCDS